MPENANYSAERVSSQDVFHEKEEEQEVEKEEEDSEFIDIECSLAEKETASWILFDVDARPPIAIAFVYALQQVAADVACMIAAVYIVCGAVCGGDDADFHAKMMSTTLFVAGIATWMQCSLGVRLPVLQGSSFAFFAPIIAMMNTEKWRCSTTMITGNVSYVFNETDMTVSDIEPWTPRIAEISGGIIMASLLQVLIGFTGVAGYLMRFIGPLTIAPVLILLSLSLFRVATDMCQHGWALSITVVVIICFFSLYLSKVYVSIPTCSLSKGCYLHRFRLFQLFAPAFAIMFVWIVSYICTVAGLFTDNPDEIGYKARTDANLEALYNAAWFYMPYPGQFGLPSFGLGAFIGMLAATIASVIESVGDYHATAKVCVLSPPPAHTINRGIASEGLVGVIAGLLGICHSTTTYSGTVGFVGITGMLSRFTWQLLGLTFIIFGMFGKFGAVLTIIPKPVIGGTVIIGLGMVVSVGLGYLEKVNTKSPRNMLILAVTLMLGMMVPFYIEAHPDIVQTGNNQVDQVLTVFLSTAMLLGGVIGFTMDNILPGNLSDRGMAPPTHTEPSHDVTNISRTRRIYSLPFLPSWLKAQKWYRYIPCFPPNDDEEDE